MLLMFSYITADPYLLLFRIYLRKLTGAFEVAMPATGLRRFVNAFATLQPTVKVQGFRSRLVSGLKSFQLPWDDEGDLYDVPYSKRRDMLVMGSIDGDVFKHVSP